MMPNMKENFRKHLKEEVRDNRPDKRLVDIEERGHKTKDVYCIVSPEVTGETVREGAGETGRKERIAKRSPDACTPLMSHFNPHSMKRP